MYLSDSSLAYREQHTGFSPQYRTLPQIPTCLNKRPGKMGTCCKANNRSLIPGDPHGRREELTLKRYLLIFPWSLWYVPPPPKHTKHTNVVHHQVKGKIKQCKK